MKKDKPIYAISGPTASGKTALGVRLAHEVGGEVINFDSVQIYRGIEIATAKPSEAEKQGIPHHLIGYVDPNINYTAADWLISAQPVTITRSRREQCQACTGALEVPMSTSTSGAF